MELVDHGLMPWPPPPIRTAPAIGRRVDHDAGAADIAVLAARGGIGNGGAVGKLEAIMAAAPRFRGQQLEPAIAARWHGLPPVLILQPQEDRGERRRPKPEADRAVRLQSRAEGMMEALSGHAVFGVGGG